MHQPKWHTMRTRATGRVRFRFKTRWLFGTQLIPEVELETIEQRFPGEYRTSPPFWCPVKQSNWSDLIGNGPFKPDAPWCRILEKAEPEPEPEPDPEIIPPHVFITARDPWLREMRTEIPPFGTRPSYVATFAFRSFEGDGELTVTYTDDHTPALNELLAYERTGGPLVIEIRHPREDET